MQKNIQNKILKNKLILDPFPYMFIRNFFDKKFVNELNKTLPSFEKINNEGIVYQSKSQTKKTVLPSSKEYKKLAKYRSFKKVNDVFQKLKPFILKKFENEIKKYVNKEFQKTKLKYHSSFSIMRSGYKKSPHLDRRDHLIHMIFYPYSDSSKGGEIILNKVKKRKNVFDIFPKKKDLTVKKKYTVDNNTCLIILNVPWAYHAVSNYYGKKDRKYFYMVYDFPIQKSGSQAKNRKMGFNENNFWKQKVKVKSIKRKKIFLTE